MWLVAVLANSTLIVHRLHDALRGFICDADNDCCKETPSFRWRSMPVLFADIAPTMWNFRAKFHVHDAVSTRVCNSINSNSTGNRIYIAPVFSLGPQSVCVCVRACVRACVCVCVCVCVGGGGEIGSCTSSLISRGTVRWYRRTARCCGSRRASSRLPAKSTSPSILTTLRSAELMSSDLSAQWYVCTVFKKRPPFLFFE